MLQQLDKRVGFHGHLMTAHVLVAHASHPRHILTNMLLGRIFFSVSILSHGRFDLEYHCN